MSCSAAERLNVCTLTMFKANLLKTFAPVKRKVLFPKFCLTFGRDSLILCLVEQLKKFENLVKYNEKQLGLMSEDREKRV